MKFTVSLSLIALAASASAAFIPRQEQTQTLQDNASLYPAGTDLSILNGNWHVTGLSSNIYSTVYSLADSKGLSLTCPQSFVNSVSSGNVEITASTFIKHRVVDEVAGVNVTSSELYVLQPPSDYIDVNDHQFSFLFQTSQWFADGAKWDTLTGAAAQDQGVIAIPGFPETTSKVNAKLISSQNDGAFDTVFLWLDPTSASGPAIEKRHAHSKRCGHKKPLIQGPSYNSTITTHDGTTDTWSGSSHSGSSHSGSSTETSHSGSSESGSTETSHSGSSTETSHSGSSESGSTETSHSGSSTETSHSGSSTETSHSGSSTETSHSGSSTETSHSGSSHSGSSTETSHSGSSTETSHSGSSTETSHSGSSESGSTETSHSGSSSSTETGSASGSSSTETSSTQSGSTTGSSSETTTTTVTYTLYAAILSRSPIVDDVAFNNILAAIPLKGADSQVSADWFTRIENTCQ